MYQLVDNLSHQAGAHALRAGVDFMFNDDTITYPRSSAAATRSLRWRTSSPAPTAASRRRSATRSSPRRIRTSALYAQDEWRSARPDAESRPALRPAIPRSRSTPTRTTCRRASASRGRRSPSHDLIVRGNGGLFFDRVPLRAVANAILSAGNTTDLNGCSSRASSRSDSRAGGRSGLSRHPPGALLTTTLVDFTTMDRHLQNAYSRQASIEVERALGEGRRSASATSTSRGDNLLMSVNQNVPTCVAAGTNNGCRPIPTYRNNNQYLVVGIRHITGCTCRSCSDRRTGRAFD